MSANSKSTIIKILCLYLGTSAIFLLIGFLFVNFKATENIFFAQMSNLRGISFEIYDIMRKHGRDSNSALEEIKATINAPFALYDHYDNLIFSNLSRLPNSEEKRRGFYRNENKVIVNPNIFPHHMERNPPHNPPRKPLFSIFIEDNNVDSEIFMMRVKLFCVFALTLTLMGIIAFFLVRLFLKPIHEQIKMLDTFIKDATHEINTPLSIILMSIETLKKESLNKEESKKIERIKLAALQINQIYSTLVASIFPQNFGDKRENFELDSVLKERLEFFAPFLSQKNIVLTSQIEKTEFIGSKAKWIIVLDNLLSNAIKYNHKGGNIDIILAPNKFILKDSGVGINSDDIKQIFERYSRFNENCGGFGIGLSLVKKICDEYEIDIKVESSDKGSAFYLSW